MENEKNENFEVRIREISFDGVDNSEFIKKIYPISFIGIRKTLTLLFEEITIHLAHFDYFSEEEIKTLATKNFLQEEIKMFDHPEDEKKNLDIFLKYANKWKEFNKKNLFNYSIEEKTFKKQKEEVDMKNPKEKMKFLKNTYLRIREIDRIESLKKLNHFITLHEKAFWETKLNLENYFLPSVWNERRLNRDKKEWKIYLNDEDWEELKSLDLRNDWKLEVKTRNYIFPGCYYIAHPFMNLMFEVSDIKESIFYFCLRIKDEDYIWRRGMPEKFRASDSFYKRNFKYYEKVLFIQKHLYNKEERNAFLLILTVLIPIAIAFFK